MLKEYIILGIGLLVIVGGVLLFYPATKTTSTIEPIITPDKPTAPLVECTALKESFDTYIERRYLPIIDDSDSLCYGLNMASNFSELTPKWAVGKLLVIEESKFTFEGISQNASIQIGMTNAEASQYKIGRNYKIDMNNVCRNFFMLVDSRSPSPLSTTLVKPEEINCK